MVWFWFVLALILLAAALWLLRLDNARRDRKELGSGESDRALPSEHEDGVDRDDGDRPADYEQEPEPASAAPAGHGTEREPGDDGPLLAPFQSGGDHPAYEQAEAPEQVPEPEPEQEPAFAHGEAPDQRAGDEPSRKRSGTAAIAGAGAGAAAIGGGLFAKAKRFASRGRSAPADDIAEADAPTDPGLARDGRDGGAGAHDATGAEGHGVPGAAGAGAGAGAAGAAGAGAHRDAGPNVDEDLVAMWASDREFEPVDGAPPVFGHGDFAEIPGEPNRPVVGLFRGSRVLVGNDGTNTVLAVQRSTSSDVVIDMRREDVGSELGLIEFDRVASRVLSSGELRLAERAVTDGVRDAVSSLPRQVRRAWIETEWVVATVDGLDDVDAWDDTVLAMHNLSGFFAALPPLGGHGQPVPADTDPGAPGAARGPRADTAAGMSGVHTDPGGEPWTPWRGGPDPDGEEAEPESPAAEATPSTQDTAMMAPVATGTSDVRSSGHLRVVQDRETAPGSDTSPVVPDTGDRPGADLEPEGEFEQETAAVTDDADDFAPEAEFEDEFETGTETETETETGTETETEPEHKPKHEAEPAPSPFDSVLESRGPVADRGDVASDYLEPQPPMPRPTRSSAQTYSSDSPMPPLASREGDDEHIKPIGSEQDDVDEIRSESEAFDAARVDGGSDLEQEQPRGRRHRPEGEVPAWLRDNPPPARSRRGGGRHRRPDDDEDDEDDDSDNGNEDSGGEHSAETPGIEPDFTDTARFRKPGPDD